MVTRVHFGSMGYDGLPYEGLLRLLETAPKISEERRLQPEHSGLMHAFVTLLRV